MNSEKTKILKNEVCKSNLELHKRSLIIYTWGNVSGIDRENRIMAIKPSGVDYEELTPDKIVLLDIDSGETLEGNLKPSSDTPTHLELYKAFPEIGGITHTHSPHATSFAQAMSEIPCHGTTHADYFYGPVPVTRKLNQSEIKNDYEINTGKVIVELFREMNCKVLDIPAVLVAEHGPFTWGENSSESLVSSVVLEEIAKMAIFTKSVNSEKGAIEQSLLNKHFLRKHGQNAYYGQ